jgi:hypothetical protein
VTDYDCWHPDHDSVTVDQIVANLLQNAATARRAIAEAVSHLAGERTCACKDALASAIITLWTSASAWARPGARSFSRGSIEVTGRSPRFGQRASVAVRSGLSLTSAAAPLALWPGAGTGEGRAADLRAHPLLEDDVLTGDVFGRRVWHGTVEYSHPVFVHAAADVAVIGFADAARAWRRRGSAGPSVAHVDVGAGLRMGTPGMRGSVELNVAYGTRDRRVVVSVGMRAPWPGLGGWP